MKKRLLALLLCMAMVLSIVACGNTGGSDKIKVGMVTDVGGVNDGSFNESSWAGLKKAEEELGY